MDKFEENKLFLRPFVIYQQYLWHQEKYNTKIQPMIVDESIGKMDNLYDFLAKTHQRATHNDDRYYFNSEFNYVEDLVAMKAIVYLSDKYNEQIARGSLYLASDADINNLDVLCDKIINSPYKLEIIARIFDVEDNILKQVNTTSITNDMDLNVLKKSLGR